MNIFIEYIPSALIFTQLAIWLELFKFAEVTQLARASAFQAESCGFESRLPLKLKNHTAIITNKWVNLL